jgi:hypothetical protein
MNRGSMVARGWEFGALSSADGTNPGQDGTPWENARVWAGGGENKKIGRPDERWAGCQTAPLGNRGVDGRRAAPQAAAANGRRALAHDI